MENNFSYNLLIGGVFEGDTWWNKEATDIDKCFKIYKITKGEIIITDNQGKEYVLQNGKTYFINAFKMDKQACKDKFSTNWFHFIPKNIYIHILMLKLPCVVEIDNLAGVSFPLTENDYEEKTEKMSHTKRILRDMKVSNYIDFVKVHLCEIQDLTIDEEVPYAEQLTQVVNYINEHYAETIKLEVLSQMCGISPSFLHKIFKAQLQMTPLNFQYILKMSKAEQLLNQRDLSVKEIAEMLSFTDSAHFNKMFKKFFGINPTSIREQKRMYLE